ncbi:hypothetical protein LV779_14625 [Streptomyces thinghirensis]|nr:hypothetical protein [Streptomyces thinghirensis]
MRPGLLRLSAHVRQPDAPPPAEPTRGPPAPLARLARARTRREDRGESRSEQFRRLAPAAESTRTAQVAVPAGEATSSPTPVEADLSALVAQGDLLGWLRAKGYRLPDDVGAFVAAAGPARTWSSTWRAPTSPCSSTCPAVQPTPPATSRPATAWRKPAGTSCASRRTRTGTPSSTTMPRTSSSVDRRLAPFDL